MSVDALDAELERCGFASEALERRPRVSFEFRWLMAPVVLVVGSWAIFERAERRGREASIYLMAAVLVGVVLVALVIQLRRVFVLRKMSSGRYRLLGWVVPVTFAGSRALSQAAGNPKSRPRSAIVGVFASPTGLVLRFDHYGLNEFVLSPDAPVRFGHRGLKRWLLVGPPGDVHAFPIHRLGVPAG